MAKISAGAIVMLSVSFLLAAILFPIAYAQIYGATTTKWNAAVVTIFQILAPILFIVGLAIRYVPTGKE